MKKSFIFIAAVVLIFSLNSCGPSACDCLDAVGGALTGDEGAIKTLEDCEGKNFSPEELAACK